MVDLGVSNADTEPWIFDTGPLSHFARAGWLGLLKYVAGDHPVVIPDVVHFELQDGVARYPHLASVLESTAGWIHVRTLDSDAELAAFAKYSSLLVGADGKKNVGECGVLALAETLPGVAIVDDGAARKSAQRNGVPLRGTLALLLDAIRDHGLSRETAGAVADDLLETTYRLPFGKGLFVSWAVENGLLTDD